MWKYFLLLVLITIQCKPLSQKELVWLDEFEESTLDLSKWTPIVGDGCPDACGFGNKELQYYSAANATVAGGFLRIQVQADSIGRTGYSSAKLVSKGKGDWQYGRVEVRAKLPRGRGTWPAIWMLPTIQGRGMKWPLDGEIDIMEHVGFNEGMIYGTIHTDLYNHKKGTQKGDSLYIADAAEAFHVYAMTWDQQSMVWEVDDEEFFRIDKTDDAYEGWPFDQKFHLILNVAVGGTWGGQYGIDETIWPAEMVVDYVRVYQ